MRATALLWSFILLLATAAALQAQDDNRPEAVRPVPPPGIDIPPAEAKELAKGVTELGIEIAELRTVLADKGDLLKLLPDVEIYHNAVCYVLTYHEFYKPQEFATAKKLLQQGLDRAKQLRAGETPWTTAKGLVVRGYRSKIDDSVQPYGLVVPDNFQPGESKRHRLDLWLHGRGENLTELSFIDGRQRSPGEFTPAGAIVLHLYGRYCNASRFAGEVDVFEAMDDVKRQYPIDDNRIVVRGFSMGGASCWTFATHHAGLWAAAAPGAGFAETAEYLNIVKNETIQPQWYHKALWHLYDSTDYAINLFNCPTIAYSGTDDKQKQAADVMEKAMAAEGLKLVHILGPNTGHKYEPKAKEEIIRLVDAAAERGRNRVPNRVRFTTWTLRYNEMLWVTVDRLEEHWQRARVDAEITGSDSIRLATSNVAALTLTMPAGLCPLDASREPKLTIDTQHLTGPRVVAGGTWMAHLQKTGGQWAIVADSHVAGLHKVHGLQGPIDDAFMDSFLMVRPTGKAAHAAVGNWVAAEQQHAIDHWRKQFRGEARVKNDVDVTDADIANCNLVLWGDPQSNRLIARIGKDLPIAWNADNVQVGDAKFAAPHHVPVLIYPNPLNPKRYVVLNSGFTFREYDYLTNARQNPKLPDYAIVDIREPVSTRTPGAIVAADFFDEAWRLKPAK